MSIALTIPLTGRHLVEAAAGTGKTHTIKTLFVRLVMEKGIPVDRILAVTYTEAAAKELKDRIRSSLEELSLPEPGDPALLELRRRREENPALFDRRLHCALRDFDEALIGTVHGFAARILSEFAFESGRAFDQELSSDNAAVLRECALDYFRAHFYRAPRWQNELLAAADVTLSKLASALNAVFAIPGAVFAETAGEPDFAALRAVAELVVPAWKADGAARLGEIFESKIVSKGRDAYCAARIEAIRRSLDDFSGAGKFDGATIEAIRAVSQSQLDENVTEANRRKGICLAPHPLSDRGEDFVRKLDGLRKTILLDGCRFTADRLARLRERDNTGSFNDLLTDLALLAQYNPEAGKLLRERFGAALVDEFQDTDPVQFEIFDRLFDDRSRPLFFVGDPKQAIYSFRGADVFTYNQAKNATPGRYALDTNFRSEEKLVQSVNEIFGQTGFPVFGCDFVTYGETIKPGGRPEREGRVFRCRGEVDRAPFKVLYCADPAVTGETREEQTAFAVRVATATAAKLLTDRDFTLAGKPVRPSDIAVLVNTNPEGQAIKQAFGAAGIPAIPRKNGSVYATPEAKDFLTLLKAVTDHDSPRSVRAAMALECFGNELGQLIDDDAVSAAELAFRKAAKRWRESGFITAFAELAAAASFRKHLVRLPDGERKLTNFFQLAELLHERCADRIAEFSELESFFGEQSGREDDDAAELRLESDADAVTIVTIHKSKGLQYPIVLIPFFSCAPKNIRRDGRPRIFHREETGRPLISIVPDDEVFAAVEEENFAEKLRLLYVATTRAVNHCILLQIPQPGRNPVDHLFHDPRLCAPRPDSAIARIEVDDPGVTPPIELEKEEIKLELAVPSRAVTRSHGTLSFTGLTAFRGEAPSGGEDGEELPPSADEPAEPAAPEAAQADSPLLELPGGINTGECFHRIFEELDFAGAGTESCRRIAEAALSDYGFLNGDEKKRGERISLLARLASDVCAAPLSPGLRLADIPIGDTLREMRFLYSLPPGVLDAAGLRRLLGAYGYCLDDGYQGRIQGGFFMTGAIDLVFRHGGRFYIVDWKSNRIDGRSRSFRREGMEDEMRRHSYHLQYLIYCVALRRYLMQRVPGFEWKKHFGGVFYLFLRGISPGDGESGIYRDLDIPEELILKLDALEKMR